MPTPVQLWGEVRQLGYVVPAESFRSAIELWVTGRGVGPWYVADHPEVHDYAHRRRPGVLDFSFALAQMGDLQIELIAQWNDTPSTYLEFLETTSGLGGLHHLAFWPDDIEAAHRDATEVLGYELWTTGRIGPEGRFRYYLTQDHPGTVLEHANIRPATRAFFADLAERSRRFDPVHDDWFVTR